MVDLVTMKARIWRDETLGAKYDDVDIPAELLEQAHEYRAQLIEAVSESDDVLMEKFIEGQPITEQELTAGIRKATILQKIFPVICGSSFKNKGVQNLLDAVCAYLPSPIDVPPMKGFSVDNHGGSHRARAEGQRALLGLDLQDHDRSVCGPACAFCESIRASSIRANRFSTLPKTGANASDAW